MIQGMGGYDTTYALYSTTLVAHFTKSNNKSDNFKDGSKDTSSSSKATEKGDSEFDRFKRANSINVGYMICKNHSKRIILERIANGEEYDAVVRGLGEDNAL